MTGMPAWGASHDDEALWPVVAFMTVLPALNADSYQTMLASAEDSGHHAADDDSHSDPDATGELTEQHDQDQPPQDQHQEHDHAH